MDDRPAISRRGLLLGLGASWAGAAICAPALAFTRGEHRTLHLQHGATGERFEGAYWSNGRFHPPALERLSLFLRDHHTDRIHRIDPELPDLVHELQTALGGAEITVLSGYRSPQTNAKGRRKTRRYAKNSYHLSGRAIDIRVGDVDLEDLRTLAMSLERGGVGFYRRANYLHLDTGPIRRWGR